MYSVSESDFKHKKYVFARNFDGIGYLKVNDDLIRLKLIARTQSPGITSENDQIELYSADEYKVKLDVKYKKTTGEETWWNEVIISIENKTGEKIIVEVKGECGC